MTDEINPGGGKPTESSTVPAAADKPVAKPPPQPTPKPPPAAPVEPADQPPAEGVSLPPFVAALQMALPGVVEHVIHWVGDWSVVVPADRLIEVARFLRDDSATAFDYCSDVTATDWPSRTKRFDVIYCLYSTRLRHRLRVKVRAGETDPVPSVTEVWPAADWLEREVYDQFGVNLVNHPDLRRILMPDEWQGYAQRKDYPLEGPGELLMEDPQDWLRLQNFADEAEIE